MFKKDWKRRWVALKDNALSVSKTEVSISFEGPANLQQKAKPLQFIDVCFCLAKVASKKKKRKKAILFEGPLCEVHFLRTTSSSSSRARNGSILLRTEGSVSL